MAALRCSHCKVNWPTVSNGRRGYLFNTCPECERPTFFQCHATAIGEAEAVSRKNHADFERFYAERESKLNGLDEVPLTASPVHDQ